MIFDFWQHVLEHKFMYFWVLPSIITYLLMEWNHYVQDGDTMVIRGAVDDGITMTLLLLALVIAYPVTLILLVISYINDRKNS